MLMGARCAVGAGIPDRLFVCNPRLKNTRRVPELHVLLTVVEGLLSRATRRSDKILSGKNTDSQSQEYEVSAHRRRLRRILPPVHEEQDGEGYSVATSPHCRRISEAGHVGGAFIFYVGISLLSPCDPRAEAEGAV